MVLRWNGYDWETFFTIITLKEACGTRSPAKLPRDKTALQTNSALCQVRNPWRATALCPLLWGPSHIRRHDEIRLIYGPQAAVWTEADLEMRVSGFVCISSVRWGILEILLKIYLKNGWNLLYTSGSGTLDDVNMVCTWGVISWNDCLKVVRWYLNVCCYIAVNVPCGSDVTTSYIWSTGLNWYTSPADPQMYTTGPETACWAMKLKLSVFVFVCVCLLSRAASCPHHGWILKQV